MSVNMFNLFLGVDLPLPQLQGRFALLQLPHIGLCSSHLIFRLRHVMQPALVRLKTTAGFLVFLRLPPSPEPEVLLPAEKSMTLEAIMDIRGLRQTCLVHAGCGFHLNPGACGTGPSLEPGVSSQFSGANLYSLPSLVFTMQNPGHLRA